MSRNPRILIYSYPDMEQISECCGGPESGYLATVFMSSEYLVSLGSCPDYPIIIWNWKNGIQLHSISSPVHDLYGQMIRVSLCRPILLAQLGRDSGKLFVWSVITTSTIVMSYKKITLPNEATAVYVDWSLHKSFPQLAIADEHGHVYISNKDGSEVNRVVFSQRCGVCLDYEMPIVCWFQDGIMLKTTFCQIRYFKKNMLNIWRREQYIESKLKPYIITVNPFKSDELFYFTEEGFLMQLSLSTTNENTLKVDKKLDLGGIYTFIDFIYPWAHDLIAIDMNFDLNIVDVTNGEKVGILNLKAEGKVNDLLSHPDFPLVVLATANGELFIVTVHERHNPSVLFKYRLQSEQLDFFKFSQCGRHLIVGEKKSGICFCITSIKNDPFSKIYQLNIEREFVDVAFYDENGVLKIIILILSSTISFISNYILIYKLLPNEENFTQAKIITDLPKFYQRLHYAPGNSKILVATPYLSRQIDFFNRTSEMKMSLIHAVKATGQQVRGIKIHTNRRYITTSGVDGVVTVVTGQADIETPTILLTHHRRDLGVSKAICSPSGKIVIALGQNGSVVCVKLNLNGKEIIKDEVERQKLIKSDYESLNGNIFRYLSGPYQIIPLENDNAKTWIDWMNQQVFLKEEKKCREKKLDIIKRLNVIKIKIQKMLDENEKCSDIEKLSIAEFDLEILSRKQKMKLAKEEREDVRLRLEFECTSMNKISNWIKKTFWDPLKVLPKSIFSIFGDKEITNYPTTLDDPQEKDMIAWNDYLVDTNTKAEYHSPELELCLLIKNRYKPTRTDERSVSFIQSLLMDDEEYENEDENEAEKQACEGNTTCKFIQPSSKYSQFEDYSFQQFISMARGMASDIQQLRDYFNKLFEKMYEVKQQELALFCERNKKIYHINSELKSLFNQTVPELLIDPEWRYQEHPESIFTVIDDEVMAEPYVSVSQQELAEKQAEEAEKKKSLLLEDDFREKALLEMIDGVLEVHWKDIIKKDIPKPKCMLTKSPDDYNVEDILAVQKYESDKQTLIQERKKYRAILETDYSDTMKVLKEQVEKFDSSLQEFSLTKMKIESAIQQLNLMRTRGYIKAFHRLEKHRVINNCQKKIVETENQIQKILEQNQFLYSLLRDLESHREQLLAKEKTMLKKVKKEFRFRNEVVNELLRQQYKKRPKVMINNASAGDFLELGNCIITNTDSKFLNHQCAEYLENVKANDIQPLNLSELITLHDWTHLIKLRRDEIELEMSLKANWMEINETECGINENNKNIEKLEVDICDLNDRLWQINHDQLISDINSEIQLVLTMGQVEIDQSGRIEETKDAVLMPIEEIQKINDKILKAADKKLKSMRRSIKFIRGYLLKEWQHNCMKMTIVNLKDDLHEIQKFPVTKDIRAYLKRQEMGLKEDKIVEQSERQILAMEAIYQKSLNHWVIKLEDIESKIETIKRNNYALDTEITNMNVDRWEMALKRDLEAEDRDEKFNERKFALLLRRSKLVLKIQQEYAEILALKNEYEVLQLNKCPGLSFKALGDKCSINKC
ncbi:hypothetical protein PV327_003945 [Microctonus hyperodae]|uniref:Cilia- and flagella-associated protein 43 n=1 Tax=Microctonus hyperodae TaxID=165561 RepID=A0AA39G510_MICHY|nr:hypothetical protein PV327_003945 [Microctonus hyperodae]